MIFISRTTSNEDDADQVMTSNESNVKTNAPSEFNPDESIADQDVNDIQSK